MQLARPEFPFFTRFSPHYHCRLALTHCWSLTKRLADEVWDKAKSAEWNNSPQELWEVLHSEPTHTAGASNVLNYTPGQTQSGHCHCLGPIPGKLIFIFLVKGTSVIWEKKNHIVCIVCTHTPHFTPLLVCYQSYRISLPDSSWSPPVPLSRTLWEEDDVGVGGRLFTVTWLVTSLEKNPISCISSFLGYL